MIVIPELNQTKQRYAKMIFTPLHITAVYKSGASRQNYQPQTLDNLLASQVLKMVGVHLTDTPDCYDIPLPLECLWRNDEGWPLWAASYFWPKSETLQWSMVQHKRAIEGYWSQGRGKDKKLSVNKASGKHKEKRIPVPAETSVTGRYTATAIGNADEIARLLAEVRYLSGRRGVGLGAIDRFEIEAVSSADVLIVDNKLARAVPVGAEHLFPTGFGPPVPSVGWTPPQWKPTLFSPGWFAGSRRWGMCGEF